MINVAVHRGNPYPERYKNGKIETPVTFKEFEDIYGRALQLETIRKERYNELVAKGVLAAYKMKLINVRALVSILYYLGLRISEVVGDIPRKYYTKREGEKFSKRVEGIRKEDLIFDDTDWIEVRAYEVRKHGKREEPLWLKKSWLGVSEIIEVWKKTLPGETLFSIDKSFAWKLVSLCSDRYPHFYRLNRATEYAKHPGTSILDLQEWFGWVDPRTIAKYMGKAGRRTKDMARRIRAE